MWFVLPALGNSSAGDRTSRDQVPLSATFITEGVLPATEIEAGLSIISSDVQREYQFGFSSLQYAWGTRSDSSSSCRSPSSSRETMALRWPAPATCSSSQSTRPLVSREHLFALGGALRLTLPSGSEARGLGGTLALAPGLLAGEVAAGRQDPRPQADAFYSWQLNGPAPIETESGSSSPDRDQRFTANLTVAHAPLHWLTGILEVNTVTVIAGDPELRGRVQMYLTPGVSLEPAPPRRAWGVRSARAVQVFCQLSYAHRSRSRTENGLVHDDPSGDLTTVLMSAAVRLMETSHRCTPRAGLRESTTASGTR